MAISKTEINLRRLLAVAPQQQSEAKLIHYVATMRELLEQLVLETTPEGLPRATKTKVNDYSKKIESFASKLAAPLDDTQAAQDAIAETPIQESPQKFEERSLTASSSSSSSGLRKRVVPTATTKELTHDKTSDPSTPIKLDSAAQKHIEKHRKLQVDLTEEMVGLARQLKESSLMMIRSLENTEKILDSTEKAVEVSLASTGHATSQATQVYSQSSKTSRLTWLAMFTMMCIFIMVVLLIRIT